MYSRYCVLDDALLCLAQAVIMSCRAIETEDKMTANAKYASEPGSSLGKL